MKKIMILFLLLTAIFIFGCSPSIPTQPTVVIAPSPPPPFEPAAPLAEVLPLSSFLINLSCTLTTDCEEGKQCIDGQCGMIEQLYQTDCASTCNFAEVFISTSDGDTYTLSPGRGSYTAAGALEWKLMNVPDYCPTEQVVVPLRIIAKNYGRVVGEYALTLREGETSSQIIHPDIPGIEFTMTVDEVKETCG